MNALRSRKEETDKGLSRGFEPKWFQKMRSPSSSSSVASPQLHKGDSSVSLGSEKSSASMASLSVPLQSPEAPTQSSHKFGGSKFGSRLIPKGASRHNRSRSTTSVKSPDPNSPLRGVQRSSSSQSSISETGKDARLADSDSKNRGSTSPLRSRSGSHASGFSRKSGTSTHSRNENISSDEDTVHHRKLGKLMFWEKSLVPSSSSHSRNRSSIGSTGSIPSESQNSVPFPAKRVNPSCGIIPEVPRVIIDSPDIAGTDRRKTNESNNRSRSSSLAHSFGRSASTSVSSVAPGANTHSPALRRSSSSEDARFRRVLPLPPPPTIGLGGVMDDPDVRNLDLDPMAVRYADHMHMLGYTWNRYVCALLARDSTKEGIKYNGMVMQAFVMRMLRFHREPLDMSLRKFLYRMALPQESQQIERMLYNFSVLWNYDNPDIFADEEQVQYVVYSLVMLHTDVFNKNIKHKISKGDYTRNAAIDGIAPEIFEYFYDNICAAPFKSGDDSGAYSPSSPTQSAHTYSPSSQLHTPLSSTFNSQDHPTTTIMSLGQMHDADDINNNMNNNSMMELPPFRPSTHSEDSGSLGSRRSSSFTWIRDQPSDPYPFLLENRLDALRPELTSICATSPFSTINLQTVEDLECIQSHFNDEDAVVLQSVSQRSRPDAYLTGPGEEVLEAQSRPGIVEVRVIKHGIVLRREVKRIVLGSHKPGWREWGVVLTNSRLYLTKNASWVRQLSKNSKVSVESLQNASVIPTRDLAALIRESDDLGSGSHHADDKLNHFVLVDGSRDCAQQRFGLRDEEEMKDWIQTINTVATQTSLNVNFQPLSATEQIEAVIGELDEALESIMNDISGYQRTLKHFKLLTPLHQRTREALVFTAGRYSSKCDDAFAEMARLQAYKNVLEVAKAASEKLSPCPVDEDL